MQPQESFDCSSNPWPHFSFTTIILCCKTQNLSKLWVFPRRFWVLENCCCCFLCFFNMDVWKDGNVCWDKKLTQLLKKILLVVLSTACHMGTPRHHVCLLWTTCCRSGASSTGSMELTALEFTGLTTRTSVVRCNPFALLFAMWFSYNFGRFSKVKNQKLSRTNWWSAK